MGRAHHVADDRFGTGDGRVVGADARHADIHGKGQFLSPDVAGGEGQDEYQKGQHVDSDHDLFLNGM